MFGEDGQNGKSAAGEVADVAFVIENSAAESPIAGQSVRMMCIKFEEIIMEPHCSSLWGNNVTGSQSQVEVGQIMTGFAGDGGLNFVTTGHMPGLEPGMTHLLNGQLLNGYTIRELNHTHPYSPTPSPSDLGFAREVDGIMQQRNAQIPGFNLYYCVAL